MAAIAWTRCLGAIETVSPWALPDGYAVSAVNVDLSPDVLMRVRGGTAEFNLTSGPSDPVNNLFTDRSSGSEALWAFSDWTGASPSAHRYTAAGGWASIALIDTPAANATALQPHVSCCAHNGKVFLAYNSGSNRLHLYDGSAVRRVGLGVPAAATVANDAVAGTYPNTLRYYKVQYRIYSASSVLLASSELGPSVSFTPSGVNTAAVITKPTTIDSATHWVVYGSVDDVTYYRVSGAIAVGTTTHSDSLTPANYSAWGGGLAPEVGLFVPPPSAQFLCTNGERVFMAGAHETTASSGETTPGTRRVWFTRPLGATDAGDDEAITQTAESRYYLDIDNEDGSPITGMVSAIDGTVYVGTSTSVWRLVDTGLSDAPVRAERVVAGVGPVAHHLMTVSDTVDGSMLYFGAADGPYRYSPSSGVQYLGADWVERNAAVGSTSKFYMSCCQWDPYTRRIYWLFAEDQATVYGKMRVLDPSLLSMVNGVMRGGWSLDHWYQVTGTPLTSATIYGGQIHIGGDKSGGALIAFRSDAVSTDDGEEFSATLTSKSFIPHDGTRLVRTDEPYIWKRTTQPCSVVMTKNRDGSTAVSVSVASTGSAGYHQRKLENLVLADASSVEVELQVTAPVITSSDRASDAIVSLMIPFRDMERA